MLTTYEPIKQQNNADFEYYFESALVDELNRQPNVVGEYLHLVYNKKDAAAVGYNRCIYNHDLELRILIEWNDTEYVSFAVHQLRGSSKEIHYHPIYSGRRLIRLDPEGIAPDLLWWIETLRKVA